MSVKRFLISLLVAAAIFISGVLVGRFVLSPSVKVVTIDVEKLVWLLEKYNVQADKIREEFAAMKEWNENALTEAPVEGAEEEKH